MAELKVPFFKASIGKEEEDAVLKVLRSGWLTTGKEAAAFEKEFAEKSVQVPDVHKKQGITA